METESLAADFFDSAFRLDLSSAAGPDSVDSFLSRLRAPERVQARDRWWKNIWLAAFLIGLVLGFLVYWAASRPQAAAPVPPAPLPAASLPEPAAAEPEPLPGPAAGPPAGTPAVASAPAAAEERVEEKFWRPLREPPAVVSVQYRRLLATGWNYIQQAKYAEAAVAFGRAVHLNSRASEAYYGLALAYFEQGLENEALSVIERVTGRQGGKADLWLLLGTAYQFQGDEKAARAAYGRYLKLSPTGPYARDVRALLSRKELPRLNFD